MCVQELRKELEKEREEHAAAAAKGAVLQQQTEQLTEEKKVLEEIQKELNSENAELRQRAEALADSAEMLLSEKYIAQNKVSPIDRHAAGCVIADSVVSDSAFRQTLGPSRMLDYPLRTNRVDLMCKMQCIAIFVECSTPNIVNHLSANA